MEDSKYVFALNLKYNNKSSGTAARTFTTRCCVVCTVLWWVCLAVSASMLPIFVFILLQCSEHLCLHTAPMFWTLSKIPSQEEELLIENVQFVHLQYSSTYEKKLQNSSPAPRSMRRARWINLFRKFNKKKMGFFILGSVNIYEVPLGWVLGNFFFRKEYPHSFFRKNVFAPCFRKKVDNPSLVNFDPSLHKTPNKYIVHIGKVRSMPYFRLT